MKKTLLLFLTVIFFLSFSAITYAGEGVVDGTWTGEGVHGTFELLLREHNGKVLGVLVAGAGVPREWRSYQIVGGIHTGDEISFTIITDGCDGRDGRGLIGFRGTKRKEEMKGTLSFSLCTEKEEDILFHKE